MATKKTTETDQTTPATSPMVAVDATAFAQAILSATEAVNGPKKKTILTRKSGSPWANKDGSAKPRLRRKMSQHGQAFIEDNLTAGEINALNRIKKAGSYINGFVTVKIRKDRGLDITYPMKTAAQRLKLMNDYGVTSIEQLANRIADEASQPKKDDDFAD